MVISEYYKVLGLPINSSMEEIKRAYREKARLYHPDINHSPGAIDKFIEVTEAYDFLIASKEKGDLNEQDYFRIVEEWRKYRQERSRQRAQYYARSSYTRFKQSKYYRSTNILNASAIIFNFAIAILVLAFTIFGYILKLKEPIPGTEKQTLFSFILLLSVSIILLSVSFLYLKAYLAERKQHRKKE